MKEDKRRKLNFDSKAVYYAPDEGSNSIGAPIFMSSSFHYGADVYQKVVDGERKSVNIYGRCGNPNEYQFEEQMIMIESQKTINPQENDLRASGRQDMFLEACRAVSSWGTTANARGQNMGHAQKSNECTICHFFRPS